MFRRFRQLHISLAAKCQILFGAAVIMIIGAALFVPWHRMDDLMSRVDQTIAQSLIEQTVRDHVLLALAHKNAATTAPSTASSQPANVLISATQPDEGSVGWASEFDLQPMRLVSASADAPGLTRFERRAIHHFAGNVDTATYSEPYTLANGHRRFRFARAMYGEAECMACHASAGASASADYPATAPTTAPAATASAPPLLGIASVDIVSQIDENQVYLNRLFILIAGLLAGTLAIASLYLIITRLILQPVRVLQETAEKVSEGDLNIRSDISTGDEFQQLSETFNVMLTNLKQSTDQLRTLNKNLDLRLGQLAESNVALYESNRLKSEFLANVSHELRTPLNSILGFAELLKDAPPTAADAKSSRYIQNILTSGRNLLELINDLLDLAKIEAGKMEVRSEPLSLSDLFEGLVGILKPLSSPKDLTLIATVAPDVPIIQTDPAKLQQVLYNFLSNAIKFSPQSGRVELTGNLIGENIVRITVEDQGPGIEPDKQELIFEKFRQLDGGVTRQYSGTGLGLAIAKELTALLNGTIGVRSEPGRGATFWINLPLIIQAGTKDVRAKLVLT